jgi:hypothetical protein
LEELPRLRYYTELTEESVIDVFAMDQWQTGSIAAIRFELRGSEGKAEYLQLSGGTPVNRDAMGQLSAKVTAGQSVQ